MQAKIIAIQARQNRSPAFPATLRDFLPLDLGSIAVEDLMNHANMSLYCLDDQTRSAIFAELPPYVDPSLSPFLHQAQFEQALGLFGVGYDEFNQLADQVNLNISKLVFIHNIGRCGSTLLHQAFNRVEPVISLSEPDAIAPIHFLRVPDRSRDLELIQLIRSSIKFLFRSYDSSCSSIGVIKLRSFSLEALDLFIMAFPDAHHFFLYRSALGWIASLHKMRIDSGVSLQGSLENALKWWKSFHNRQIDLQELGITQIDSTLSSIQQLTLSWLLLMDRYMRFYQQGITMPALKYEDLSNRSSETLSALFSMIGLPCKDIPAALSAFNEDSQAGTSMARIHKDQREDGFSEMEIREIEAILHQHPLIRSSDYVAPQTILQDGYRPIKS